MILNVVGTICNYFKGMITNEALDTRTTTAPAHELVQTN